MQEVDNNGKLKLYEDLLQCVKELVAAEKNSLKACNALRNLPLGESREKRGRLSSKWTVSAEDRDRIKHKVHIAAFRAGVAGKFSEDYYKTSMKRDGWGMLIIEREQP